MASKENQSSAISPCICLLGVYLFFQIFAWGLARREGLFKGWLVADLRGPWPPEIFLTPSLAPHFLERSKIFNFEYVFTANNCNLEKYTKNEHDTSRLQSVSLAFIVSCLFIFLYVIVLYIYSSVILPALLHFCSFIQTAFSCISSQSVCSVRAFFRAKGCGQKILCGFIFRPLSLSSHPGTMAP